MTKPQIWVAVFLLLFLVLFIMVRMTKQDDGDSMEQVGNTTPQTEMSSGEVSVTDLIKRNGCITCHGADLNGTPMAPALENLSENWNRDNLVNYLRNPSSFMDSDRFKAYRQKYPGTIMPPYNNVDIKDLGKMADYLLTR